MLLILLFPILCQAQKNDGSIFPLKDGKVYYEKIIQIDSVSKSTLHNRAKAWALSHFRSQKDALQTEDKESGILVYKGYYDYNFKGAKYQNIEPLVAWKIWSTYTILVKEGKAKIINTDVIIDAKDYGEKPAETFLSTWEYDMNNGIEQVRFMRKALTKNFQENRIKVIEALKTVDALNRLTIQEIENYLTGKIKSDLEF